MAFGDAVVINGIPSRIYTGVETEFTVTTYAGASAGVMVQGQFAFPETDYTAWYYETSGDQAGQWVQFTGNTFGPEGGFPFTDGLTSYFKVQFNEAVSGNLDIQIVAVSGGEVVCSASAMMAVVEGTTIEAFNALVAQGGVVDMTCDVQGQVNINNSVVINGNGYMLRGNILMDASSTTEPYSVAINNLDMVQWDNSPKENKTYQYGIHSQNQGPDGFRPVNITLQGCKFSVYQKKGIYMTNPQTFVMNGCTIGDVATLPMNSPNTYGDYAVDLNICGIENAVVSVVGNTFTSACGGIGALKVTQRGGVGLTDDVNTDISATTSATIQSLTVSNNDFSGITTDIADVVIGSSPNSSGTARTWCTAYDSVIDSSGETQVKVRGSSAGDMLFTMPDDTMLTIKGTPVAGASSVSPLAVTATEGVTFSGVERADVTLDIPIDWITPDGGVVGGGMLGFRRYIIRCENLPYTSGGVALPDTDFEPVAIIGASAQGGIMAYWNSETEKVQFYRDGAEATGSVVDLTLVFIGH